MVAASKGNGTEMLRLMRAEAARATMSDRSLVLREYEKVIKGGVGGSLTKESFDAWWEAQEESWSPRSRSSGGRPSQPATMGQEQSSSR